MSEEILNGLAEAIIRGDEEKAKEMAKKAIEANIDPLIVINNGLMKGMQKVSEDFNKLIIYLPEVMMAAEAMKAALSILEPKILEKKVKEEKKKIVIGTIQGDIHDIGKNIVALLLKANGFEVYDLGRDVPVDEFIKKAEEVNAEIIAASTLLSTSMPYMEDLINLLKERGLRDKYIVMVGGGPVTREWAMSIGADGYGEDGEEAVRVAKELIKVKKK
ncbi:MAG: corrinoid protein [Candidatus Methanomethylicia archaeon]|jgi:corrinoid protein of di/trimethylamine methyltransferase|uniref:Dimethylamine corrinoid protein 3 n=1 Tax=Thermoproteota archaeon TaxID=2056631 RepID=A0A523BA61_9CREN|nr:corrinoid protein [Candidatus Methanomethylicia archaeon]MCQ5340737.1 corrinoid protein [Candidatus Methanomethylicia archaeon]NHV45795.1 dimethylamine corrinoid protein 3 [Candidatus Verstraetearchaeota archaeon]RZN55670.1 MAG: dimethylamine corrinoid protein 3 [Candidatus Verstraetearchaeota archaeon]TDA37821.1 MAG: dimethylamine corrinoid protein 3 [Candidatus Verstraetearchaeota archaeon]